MRTLRRYRRPAALGLVGGGVVVILVLATSPFPLSSAGAAIPAGLIVAVAIAALTMSRNRTLASIGRLDAKLDRVLGRQDALDQKLAEVGAISTMAAMDVTYPLPLGSDWALAWDAAVVLAREVGARRPSVVVELGSGGSSLVIGMQLRRTGAGHLYTLDHEPTYAAITRRHVQAQGLEAWVTVLDAPLIDWPLGDDRFRWYRLPDEVRALERIDLLVVDGPPQDLDRSGTPRYPAIPVLGERLGAGSVVFVDDANRDGERRTLARWTAEDPRWRLDILPTARGTAILRQDG
jgi:predicted O-methyltransferase YrrM